MCVRVLYCTYIQYMHVFVNLNLLMCKSVVIVSVCRFSIYWQWWSAHFIMYNKLLFVKFVKFISIVKLSNLFQLFLKNINYCRWNEYTPSFPPIQVLKAARSLVLYVQSVGRVPGSFQSHQTYTWVDPQGRSVSPPPDVDPMRQVHLQNGRKSNATLLKSGNEKRVTFVHLCKEWTV